MLSPRNKCHNCQYILKVLELFLVVKDKIFNSFVWLTGAEAYLVEEARFALFSAIAITNNFVPVITYKTAGFQTLHTLLIFTR